MMICEVTVTRILLRVIFPFRTYLNTGCIWHEYLIYIYIYIYIYIWMSDAYHQIRFCDILS